MAVTYMAGMGHAGKKAIVSGCDNTVALLATGYEHTTDMESLAGGSQAEKQSRAHEVLIPAGPIIPIFHQCRNLPQQLAAGTGFRTGFIRGSHPES